MSLRFFASLLYASIVAKAAAFNIDGDSGLPYFPSGEDVRLSDGRPGDSVAIRDGAGKVVVEGVFRGDGTFSASRLKAGYYEASSGDEVRSFAITYPRKSMPSVVGLDAHLSDDGMYKPQTDEERIQMFRKHLVLARHTGAWYLRERFRWGRFQSSPEQWDDTVFNRFYLPQIEAGFSVVAAVESLPSWAQQIPGKSMGPPVPAAWAELFRTLASRYGVQMPLLQAWNEPNPIGIAGSKFPGGITPQKYASHYLDGARAGIDAAGVDGVKLVLGGAAGMDPAWHEKLIRDGHLRGVDIFDVHPYAREPFTFEPSMRQLLGWLDEAGFTGPVMGTEWASHERIQAPDRLAQMYVLWFSLDARMRKGALFKFDLRDWRAGVGTQGSYQLGIARHDYSPKPEFAAMNIVASRLAGGSHEKTVLEQDQVSAQLIRDSEGRLFGSCYAAGPARTVWLKTASEAVDIMRPEGGEAVRRSTLAGVFPLEVGGNRFVYLDGIKTMEPVSPIFSIASQPNPEKAVLKQGTPHAYITYELWNPADKAVVFRGVLKGSENFEFIDSRFEVKLAPREKIHRTAAISYHGPVPVSPHSFIIDLEVPELSFRAELPAVLEPALGSSPELALLRDETGQPCVRVQLKEPLAPGVRLTLQMEGVARPFVMQQVDNLRYDFKPMMAELPVSKRVQTKLLLSFPSGLSSQVNALLGFKDHLILDNQQRVIEPNRDHPLNLFLAQPVVLKGKTLSSVELPINNYRGRPISVSLEIRDSSPVGPILARGTASILNGSNWNMFVLDKIIEDIVPGQTYWIVLTTTTSDRVLWGYRRLERPDDKSAQFSHDQVGWSVLKHKGAEALQFAYRIYN